MVVLNRIYTKSGDGGETALGDGSRVPKTDARVEAYGTVDELNAAIGLARQHAEDAIGEALARVQNDLFDLGADFCRPDMARDGEATYAPLRMVEAQVERLEAEIDGWNADLTPLRSFILPGGSPLAAHLHMCRTVARRAERRAIALAAVDEVNGSAMRYLNRLSDWFFVLGRVANRNGEDDILWVPGANRG